MKIHFCDLCNESVPQADVEAGRAFLRRGRVICAKCDALMSSAGEEGYGTPALAGDTPPVAAPASAATPAPIHGQQPGAHAGAHPVHATRGGRGTGAGIGIAIVALLVAVTMAVWSWNERAQQRSALQRDLGALRGELALARTQGERTDILLREARQEEAAARSALQQALGEQDARVSARLKQSEGSEERTDTSLAGFGQRIEAVETIHGEVRRHDAELVLLQQRFGVLADDLSDLRARVAEAAAANAKERGAAQAPPTGVPAAPPEPAWAGLVGQLASKNQNERWLAVQALEETRDPAAAAHLLPLLKDPDIFMRLSVARALGTLRSPPSIGPLIEALEDADAAVREMAYVALKSVSGRDFPFDPLSSDAAERAKRVRVWQDWWKKERERLAPG